METDDAVYTPKVYEDISYLNTTLWGQKEVFPRAESKWLERARKKMTGLECLLRLEGRNEVSCVV